DQVVAMVNGNGTIALCSSDKFARVLLTKDTNVKQGLTRMAVFFPNQQDRGAHVDIAGAAVVANAPHRDNAIKFLEFMVSPDAQRLLADINFVYPVRKDVPPTAAVVAFGTFKADDPR